MEFFAKTSISSVKSDCLVVNISADKRLNETALIVDQATSGGLMRLVNSGDLTLKSGKTHWLCAPEQANYKRILLLCTGEKSTGMSETDLITCAQTIANLLTGKAIKTAVWVLDGLNVAGRETEWICSQIAQQTQISLYRYSETKKLESPPPALRKLTIHCRSSQELRAVKKGFEIGSNLGDGINFARMLGDLPANICTPSYLADHAKSLGTAHEKLKTTILDEKKMERLNMGSLLSVAAGTEEPAKLIVMEYKGKTTKSPIVLVGKGITFDTGGISLKPGAAMDEMKYDMCGAASVFGAMKALVQMNAPVHVVGIVAATENMPSGRATKPGDVVKSMSGQTIEILNTDAEGRLVLCDALTYAERFKPKVVIDIATLTGACIIALGNHATGLYANDQALADALLSSGQNAHDKAWQMPLWDDYHKQLKSNFADVANIGGREAGSVTAACFLSRFAKNFKWAHLDIAGTAWKSGAAKGATGRPVGLLVNFVLEGASGL